MAAKKKPPNDKIAVDALMKELKHPLKAEVEAVRSIMAKANKKIVERIKWNSPSFYYKDVDMAAFHLRAQDYVHVIFVFPPGTMVSNSDGLLEGDHKDRREAKFHGMKDVKAKKAALEKVVNEWVALVDAQ